MPASVDHAPRLLPFSVYLICGVFFIVGIFALNRHFLYTPDSARYLIWAKSLASFEGYKDSTSPETIRYVMHSPFYSLLLSPVARIFSLNAIAAKSWTLLIGVGTLLLIAYWLRKSAGPVAAMLGCIVLATNPLFLLYSTEILSDVPFISCMVLAFILADTSMNEGQPARSVFWWLILVITAGVLTREIGLSLFASVVVFFIVRRDFSKAVLCSGIPVAIVALWFLRNEVIVAPAESPSITYSGILTHHFFTSNDVSLVSEFFARAAKNADIYSRLIGSLVFFPLYRSIQYDVVARDAGLVASVSFFLAYGKYLLMVLTAGMGLHGMVIDYRRSKIALIRFLFLFFYLSILLFYPINDIRLLLPMLVLMIYYISLSGVSVISRYGGTGSSIGKGVIAGVVLLILPNAVWEGQLLVNNYSCNWSEHTSGGTQGRSSQCPPLYRKPFASVANWIVQHSEQSAVVLSKWKELACWLEGRKLYSVDENISLNVFERLLRDYHVHYIVSSTDDNGWKDFELPLDLCRKYSFTTAYRDEMLEVLQVQTGDQRAGENGSKDFIRAGFSLLDQGRYEGAEKIFTSRLTKGTADFSALFFTAVAQEFAFKFESAEGLFSQFRSLPLSGYLDDAAVHHDIIGLLRSASDMPSGAARAELYFRAASAYWNLGFRTHARFILRQSLISDSAFVPAYVFGIHFALEEQDTTEAKLYLNIATQRQQGNAVLYHFSRIIGYLDSLSSCRSPEVCSQYCLEISQSYHTIGLEENAIDDAFQSIKADSTNLDAHRVLAVLYRSRQRYAPALAVVEHALQLVPRDPGFLQQKKELEKHF